MYLQSMSVGIERISRMHPLTYFFKKMRREKLFKFTMPRK